MTGIPLFTFPISQRIARRLCKANPASCSIATKNVAPKAPANKKLLQAARAFGATEFTVVDVNVHGLWYCARAVGQRMIERGGGVIVNIGSISAMIVNRPQMQPAYNASKAAVHQLTKSLAAEWAPHKVRVNALAPRYVRTAMAPVDKPEFRQRWIDDVPMQRCADPEELEPTIVHLASDASSFMTGSVLVADGGYTLW